MTGPAADDRTLIGEHASGEALDRLVRFACLLDRWSSKHSLVRFHSRRELVDRHIRDALEGARLVAGRGRLIDVGSGAGLPGVPLLVLAPAWSGVLLEPRQKRWAFLKAAIRDLGLDAEAWCRRTDQVDRSERFDLVTARAVGGHGEVLEWARPRLTDDGAVAVWTTVDGERELAEKPGWRVLSWPLVGLDRGRLVMLKARGHCST
jgi:16S rRNA (guanine527-N7)-methyltransferase